MPVTILTEAELRGCVGVDAEAVAAIEEAFTWLADGQVEMPPIMHIAVPEHKGDVDIKSAYAQGLDYFAVKIGAGFFENHKLGLPNSPASVVLVSARTGVVAAVLLDNAYLTDVRTGAAGAVVAKHLAAEGIETAGVIGSGAQARYQMRGLKEVRDFRRLLIHGIDAPGVAAYVAEMPAELGVEVMAVDAETLVRESQVLVTTTPSREPIIEAGWLHSGLHITAMGADLAGKRELGPGVPEAAGLVVCDHKTQCFSMGELQHAALTEAQVTELGEITSGRAPGRQSAEEITLCDLTGTGVQDTAIAALAYEKAIAAGLGVTIES
jgi:ornithine cyclodeaminase